MPQWHDYQQPRSVAPALALWLIVPALLAVVTIAPAGFLMGMCFPMGIQIARRFHATLVPWGWGVNAAFSVFASVLSIVLAVSAGFKMAMLVGIACYALAFLIATSLLDDPTLGRLTPARSEP